MPSDIVVTTLWNIVLLAPGRNVHGQDAGVELALTDLPICFSRDVKLSVAEYADFLALATTYAAAPVSGEMSISITCWGLAALPPAVMLNVICAKTKVRMI
jgi:hypothetical protein